MYKLLFILIASANLSLLAAQSSHCAESASICAQNCNYDYNCMMACQSQADACARGSVRFDCNEGRNMMDGLSQFYGRITDTESCNRACQGRGESANSGCYMICQQCYTSRKVPERKSERTKSSTHVDTPTDLIDRRATKTEKRLIQFVQKSGTKKEIEHGTNFHIEKIAKKQAKKQRFVVKIRSLSPDEHGCTAKVSEANGTPMEVMGVAFYKAAKKRCKKLKVGQKVKLTPREIMYLFMKEVPQNGKRNIGMLAVFPY